MMSFVVHALRGRGLVLTFVALSACAVAAEPTRPTMDAGPGNAGWSSWAGSAGDGQAGTGEAGYGGAGASGSGGAGKAGAPGGSGGSSAAGTGGAGTGGAGTGGAGTGGAGTGGAGTGGTGGCTAGEHKVTGACEKCGEFRSVCQPGGTWKDEGCVNQKACNPNDTKTEECGNCGTQKYKCSAQCGWVKDGTCDGQGTCKALNTIDCLCTSSNTHCGGTQTCTSSCGWGTCELKTGQCDWNSGNHWRCCGKGKWEYCLKAGQWSGNCVADAAAASCDY